MSQLSHTRSKLQAIPAHPLGSQKLPFLRHIQVGARIRHDAQNHARIYQFDMHRKGAFSAAKQFIYAAYTIPNVTCPAHDDSPNRADAVSSTVGTFKVGLWIILAGLIASLATLAFGGDLLGLLGGVLLFAGCMISAGAVERYRRAQE